MNEKILCGYCNKELDIDEITNRVIPPFMLSVRGQRDEIFCSAKCGNKYCIDKNISYRYCINPNCGQRGAYHKKTFIFPPENVLCSDCFRETTVTCECCGRKYHKTRSKAKKTGEPDRFCGIKCKKSLTLHFDNKINK